MKARILCIAAAAMLLAVPSAADEAAVTGYPASYFAHALPNTAYDMVMRLPGFTFDDGNNARGFAGTAGNVVIDGQRPTSKTDDLQSILERIPASDVDRIEIVRGGAPGVDMQGLTVVANVVLRKRNATAVVVDVEDNIWPDGHHAPQASVQFTRQVDGSTFEASLTRLGNFSDAVGDGIHDITDVATGTVSHAHARLNGFAAGAAATGAATIPLWGGRFRANIALQNSPNRSASIYTAPGADETITDRSGNQSAELGLHWIGHIGGPELETLVLQRLGRQTDRNADDAMTLDQVFTSKTETGESIARATLRYTVSPRVRVQGGGEAAYNTLDGISTYTENGVGVPLPSADAHVNEKRGEAFAQGTWNISKHWTLEAGARFEFSTIAETGDSAVSRSFFYPKPRLLLTWAPSATDQVRFRYEKVLGQLDFTNFVASASLSDTGVHAGNANMKPDQHAQFELDYEHDFWGKGALVLSFLHEDITDVMDYIPIAGPSGVYDAPGNIGNGHSNEFDSILTLPTDRLGLDHGLLQVTNIWRFSGVHDPVTGQMRRISGQRPQKIEVRLTQDIESLKSTWSVYYFDCWDEYYARATLAQHSRCIPPYVTLTWEYKPTPSWSLHFEVDNVLPFGYQVINRNYTGERGLSPLVSIEDTKYKSQPRLFVQIRKTFG